MIVARLHLRIALTALLFIWQTLAHAVPQIHWGDMLDKSQNKVIRESLELDLRQHWESTVVGSVAQNPYTPLEPDQVWDWPGQRFSLLADPSAVALQANQRLISRMTVFSESLASDFIITVLMPRVDIVHLSYRYDNGPWKNLSSGDRIAMDRWPLADRQPSFHLPLPPGQLDIVMQFAHRGVLNAPVLLQNNRAFLAERTGNIWASGIFIGVNLVMALMGVLMALNFKKSGFLAVTAMGFVMALVLISSSGLGAMFVNTGSDEFSDLSKFIINTSWGALLPSVAAIALGTYTYSARLWWMSILMTAGVFVGALVLANYEWRDTTPISVGILMALVMIFFLFLLAITWLKNYSRNLGITIGLLLYPTGLFVLFLAYSGMFSADTGGKIASLLATIASILIIRGLFLQHRMGRQVLARANTSPVRDVLTGLLNREGMQAHLYKLRERLQQQQACAVFIYISFQDAPAVMDQHGEQGFEMGMVQVAANLSTSVTSTDGVARISGSGFGITVILPPNSTLAIRIAQKILSHLLVLATHGTQMASAARMALAWMPLNGFRLDTLERRCMQTLQALDHNKRIGWVGGVDSEKDAALLLTDSTLGTKTASNLSAQGSGDDTALQNAASANLYERIRRIEHEMLHDVDTRFLVDEANRMSHAMNEAKSTLQLADGIPESRRSLEPSVTQSKISR